MGNKKSKVQITDSECQDFANISNFSADEICFLHIHFRRIAKSKSDDGIIDYHEFISALKINDSLISQRLFRVIDQNEDGRINFREFVVGLSFLVEKDQVSVSRFVFRLFDCENRHMFGINEICKTLESCLSQFPHVKLNSKFLREFVIANMEEFAVHVKNRLEGSRQSFNNVKSLNQLHLDLQNLKSFNFTPETFFIYYKFNPVFVNWFQSDINNLRKQTALLLNKS